MCVYMCYANAFICVLAYMRMFLKNILYYIPTLYMMLFPEVYLLFHLGNHLSLERTVSSYGKLW